MNRKAMSLKAKIRNLAKEKDMSAQVILKKTIHMQKILLIKILLMP